MYIERIQVEEGFLDGLDLRLVDGLNVIIGARGTGKTSIIELMRFCLGVSGYTEASERLSREHALSVLGSGQVTLTLKNGSDTINVSRTAEEPEARVSGEFDAPIMFSQKEIESVGLSAGGRLRIIDGFAGASDPLKQQELSLQSRSKSLTAEMDSISGEVDLYSELTEDFAHTETELKRVALEEKRVSSQSDLAKQKQAELQELSDQTSELSVRDDVFSRTLEALRRWKSELDDLTNFPPSLEEWPDVAGPVDLIQDGRRAVALAVEQIKAASTATENTIRKLQKTHRENEKAKIDGEQKAREIRIEIEALQKGAGEIARRANQLRERIAQIRSMESLSAQKRQQLSKLQNTRGDILDSLDSVRADRFNRRKEIAKDLNQRLAPQIRVRVNRAAQYAEYTSALVAALRGSGLRYNDLAPLVTSRVSPRELVEASELNAHESIAAATKISIDRVVRMLGHIRDHGGADIVTSQIEDDVTFELLDGDDYKGIDNLSTGQRCTVVLPIILEHTARTIIVDQPEDHLDNAFVAEVLIKSILDRQIRSQTILTTHNANIPVLGDADQVVALGSDGRRGFVRNFGELESAEIVRAIMSVMEGGKEAFETRAKFYNKYYNR